MIVAARTLAPNSPTANSASASRPATGSSALAASAADVMVPPATPIVLAAATTMKIAMTLVQIEPPTASACSSRELVHADALLGDRARQVELHVRA